MTSSPRSSVESVSLVASIGEATEKPAAHAAVHLVEERRLTMRAKRGDDLLDVAFDDAIELVDRELDAVIADAVLRIVVRADLLAPLARSDHSAALGGDRGVLLLALDVEEAAAENLQCLRFVLEL